VRVVTVLLGWALAALPPDPFTDPNTPAEFRAELDATARPLEPWFRFDAMWHANVARHGYAEATGDGGRYGVAFHPVVPGIMAAADAVGVNMFWAIMLAANLTGAAGAAVFARVAARLLNDPSAAWRALALLLAFPTALFYSAPYHESFGLLFAALTLGAWQADRSARTMLFAFVGSLSRFTGVALGAAAVADWLTRCERKGLARAAGVAVASVAGVLAFWCVLWVAVGDPLAGVKSQRHWGRPPLSWRNPLLAIESINDPVRRERGEAALAYGEAAITLGAIILGIRAWRTRGAFWGVATLVPVAIVVTSGSLLSAHRILLACLPAFIELADLLRGRRLPFAVVLAVFVSAQLHLLNRFVHWQFAG
jgi:hypothetical protein